MVERGVPASLERYAGAGHAKKTPEEDTIWTPSARIPLGS